MARLRWPSELHSQARGWARAALWPVRCCALPTDTPLDSWSCSPLPPAATLAGVEEIYGLGSLNEYEQAGLKAMMPELRASIEKGIAFAKGE